MYRPLLPDRPRAALVTVYLIHFDAPYKHARHYCGKTILAVEERLIEHLTSQTNAAALMKRVAALGIGWTLARTWENVPPSFEYRVKNQGGLARVCPICTPIPRVLSLEA